MSALILAIQTTAVHSAFIADSIDVGGGLGFSFSKKLILKKFPLHISKFTQYFIPPLLFCQKSALFRIIAPPPQCDLDHPLDEAFRLDDWSRARMQRDALALIKNTIAMPGHTMAQVGSGRVIDTASIAPLNKYYPIIQYLLKA